MPLFDLFRRGRPGRGEQPALLGPAVFPTHPLNYAENAYLVPVLVISYFPVSTAGGGRISRSATGDIEGSLDVIRSHTEKTTQQVVEALESGSVYHGYKDVSAQASLRYAVLDSIEFLEPLPTWSKPGHGVPMTDYNAIMAQVDIRSWVEERGVKEVWIWGYHGGVVDLWESNMSGPYGDISNSDRDPHDLPVLDRTYTVYHYNYGRGAAEAVEDHIHQIEAMLRQVDAELFWERFVGGDRGKRCGWAHFPPNGRRDYDWANTQAVETDIEDWTPEGGPRQWLNCQRWRGDHLSWFIYWMENLPGLRNGLEYRGRPLTNWWDFVGNWDEVMRERRGLTLR